MKMKALIRCNQATQRRKRAFTLIEMIGVLAVIAVVAALLIPKVFKTSDDARISGACVSIDNMKSAATGHFNRYGSLNISNTTALTVPVANFDMVLLGEGLIDKPFASKIGTGAAFQLVAGPAGNAGAGYNLGGGESRTTNQSCTAECVISNVAAQDAFDLSVRIDGPSLTASNNAGADSLGRVEYSAASFPTTVYIYVTGR